MAAFVYSYGGVYLKDVCKISEKLYVSFIHSN